LKILKQRSDLRHGAARQILRQCQILRDRKSCVLMRGDDTVEERRAASAILRIGGYSIDQRQQRNERRSPVTAESWLHHSETPDRILLRIAQTIRSVPIQSKVQTEK
jgi:hypothetical protein